MTGVREEREQGMGGGSLILTERPTSKLKTEPPAHLCERAFHTVVRKKWPEIVNVVHVSGIVNVSRALGPVDCIEEVVQPEAALLFPECNPRCAMDADVTPACTNHGIILCREWLHTWMASVMLRAAQG